MQRGAPAAGGRDSPLALKQTGGRGGGEGKVLLGTGVKSGVGVSWVKSRLNNHACSAWL